jgi:hypothetical protein
MFGELWAFSQPFRASLLTDFSHEEVEQLIALLARIPTAMRRAGQLID